MLIKNSLFTMNKSAVLVSDHMGGKMLGIPSISTSCLMNPRCLSRIEKATEDNDTECICWYCFAADGLAYKRGLRDNTTQNYELLNSRVLATDELPIFSKYMTDRVRIESFGDVASVTQCLNYLNICNINPEITFTMWTKNPDYWDEAIKEMGKPKNLICVLSSMFINQQTQKEVYGKYTWLDKVFTVYSLDWLLENLKSVDEIDKFVNCGARSCKKCSKCYLLNDDTFFINELKKQDQHRLDKIRAELNND